MLRPPEMDGNRQIFNISVFIKFKTLCKRPVMFILSMEYLKKKRKYRHVSMRYPKPQLCRIELSPDSMLKIKAVH